MDKESNHYFIRLLARIIDLFFIGLLIQSVELAFPSLDLNLLPWFVVYNLTVILLGGKTLGKFSFSLIVKSSNKSRQILNLVIRELLFIPLLPLLLINFICAAPLPLHDRISRTKVIKDE